MALGVALSQSSSWRAATAQLRQLLQRGEPEVDGADGPRVSPFAEVPDGTPALVSTRSFEAILERCVRGARESGEWSGAEAVVVAVAELRPKQLTPQLCALAIRACLLASGRRRGNAAPVASASASRSASRSRFSLRFSAAAAALRSRLVSFWASWVALKPSRSSP